MALDTLELRRVAMVGQSLASASRYRRGKDKVSTGLTCPKRKFLGSSTCPTTRRMPPFEQEADRDCEPRCVWRAAKSASEKPDNARSVKTYFSPGMARGAWHGWQQ